MTNLNFEPNKIERLEPDFHYTIISFSATIGGFLFTGVSILLSIIDKKRIQRLWNFHYLDNLIRSAFIGIAANVLDFILGFYLVLFSATSIKNCLICAEVALLCISVIFFIWCGVTLFRIVFKLKEDNESTNETKQD